MGEEKTELLLMSKLMELEIRSHINSINDMDRIKTKCCSLGFQMEPQCQSGIYGKSYSAPDCESSCREEFPKKLPLLTEQTNILDPNRQLQEMFWC